MSLGEVLVLADEEDDVVPEVLREVSSKTVAFHQLDSKSKSRIKQLRVSAETGEEVPYTQIVKGYELSSGEYVEITEEELSALDPKAARTIDLDEFVDLVDIDPIFFDKAYYLAPDKAPKPYALLVQAMEESGKVGIAHFVMRTKQYLAAIRAHDGVMVLSTMVLLSLTRRSRSASSPRPSATLQTSS